MPSPGMGMMGNNNPYGPSGPLPPSMGGQMMPSTMRPMGMSSVNQKVLSNTQLQQLSAQIKAYRMLSRSINLPEALISIVQGRKPTAAMLGSLNKAAQQAYQLSGGVPSPAGSSQSAAGTGRESPAQTNISLYPLSPSTGQAPTDGSTLKPPSHLTQSHSSVPSPAPNVTLQPGGELPPQVHVGRN